MRGRNKPGRFRQRLMGTTAQTKKGMQICRFRQWMPCCVTAVSGRVVVNNLRWIKIANTLNAIQNFGCSL